MDKDNIKWLIGSRRETTVSSVWVGDVKAGKFARLISKSADDTQRSNENVIIAKTISNFLQGKFCG
jgi:hypothetical protein